jgi:hypothetical protein
MATFHAKGKAKLTILVDNFGISYVTKKCLCVMFGFYTRIVHVSKDEMYDDNNNVIRSIYQVLIFGDFGLEWRVNAGRFKIVVESLPKSSQNIVLTLEIVAFVLNVVCILWKSSKKLSQNVSIFNFCS